LAIAMNSFNRLSIVSGHPVRPQSTAEPADDDHPQPAPKGIS